MGWAMGAGSPVLNYTSGVKITIDGNSIAKGQGTADAHWDAQMLNRAPFNGNVPITNVAVDGWTIPQMIANSAAVDASFDPTKTNILIAWEGSNTLDNILKTPQEGFDLMAQYCAARLALHPWLIVMASTLIRSTDVPRNLLHIQYNNLLKANYRAIGAKMYVDLRSPGSVFDFPNYDASNFGALYQTDLIHPNTNGNTEIAKIFAAALRRMPKR